MRCWISSSRRPRSGSAAGQPAEELADAPAAFHEAYLLRILSPMGGPWPRAPTWPVMPSPSRAWSGVGEPSSHISVRLGPLGSYRVVSGAIGADQGHRIVQIATSLDSYEGELSELRGVLWTILPAGLVVATIGGYWLAGRSLAPVQRMTEAARRISAANLGERIEVANPDDELGRLGATLNAMLDRIDRAFAATRRFTADAAHELKTPAGVDPDRGGGRPAGPALARGLRGDAPEHRRGSGAARPARRPAPRSCRARIPA